MHKAGVHPLHACNIPRCTPRAVPSQNARLAHRAARQAPGRPALPGARGAARGRAARSRRRRALLRRRARRAPPTLPRAPGCEPLALRGRTSTPPYISEPGTAAVGDFRRRARFVRARRGEWQPPRGSTFAPTRKGEQRHGIKAGRLPGGHLVQLPQPVQQVRLSGRRAPACRSARRVGAWRSLMQAQHGHPS